MALHVGLRPGELRRAEWSDIDLVERLWTILRAKMKAREEQVAFDGLALILAYETPTYQLIH